MNEIVNCFKRTKLPNFGLTKEKGEKTQMTTKNKNKKEILPPTSRPQKKKKDNKENIMNNCMPKNF